MPWDLLSRIRRPLRRPARSTPDSDPPLQDTTLQPHQHSQPQIDRKILEDPSSLLEADATPEPALPRGLTPSTRLPSAEGNGKARSRPKPIDFTPKPLPEQDEPSPGSLVDVSPRSPSKFGRSSKIAGGGEWSTFGRKREHRIADVAGISGRTSPPNDPQRTSQSTPTKDGKHLSVDSVASIFTLSRVTNPFVAHGARSSPGKRSPDDRSGSRRASPTDTTSSKRHPQTPQGPASHTTPAAASTPINCQATVDSPHTFGQPTPPENVVEFSVPSSSPPPPLPPLDHPELAAVLSSRSRRPVSAFRDRSQTLPTDQTPSRSDDLFKSLSLRLRRSIRRRSSPLQAEMAEHPRRRRARTMSSGARPRRTSADWNAHQASVGSQAWPAEVSREIVRLSLRGTPPRAGPVGVPGSTEKRKTTRGGSRDPGHRSHRGAMPAASFLPFPHPSRPSTPTPTASATPADQEVTPDRPHSLKYDLGNRRGSQRSTRFAMTEVKRSSSAIESRNARRNEASGAVYPSLGLPDPGRTQAHQATPSHPSSALTPSRALSGRVSLPDTPMAASAQGEPSTPTPAPRHLSMSDKSRGKRKAEDNIDLTPPEHKKEGQRATFLLPSETRSQRVSSSSHAPSSYHRKRARLSSTSPFATPAQSRPSSVQETPNSGSRNRPFSSLSSSTGARIAPPRTPSRAASARSRQPPTPSTTRKHERHQSISQISIPISAIVSPHAPSISRSAKFHMRDPRRPPKKPNDTAWSLRFRTEDEPGSPVQAWCFFFGFLLFPIWWIAGLLLPVPRTRIAGDVDAEKGVAIDDPQIEHDARIWRFRCRVMAVVSLLTYIPFIVLVAIYAPR